MGKILIGVLIVGVIGVGGYFLLDDNNSFRVSFFGQGASTSPAVSTTSSSTSTGGNRNIIQTIQEGAVSAIQSAGSWIGEKSKQLFSSVTDGVQSTIESGAKDAAHSVLTSAESALGLSSGSSTDTPLSVSYVASSGSTISFMVRNLISSTLSSSSPKELISYSIDWGDEVVESKKDVVAQEVYTFSHAWQKAGDYVILFKILLPTKESSYTTHITVQ